MKMDRMGIEEVVLTVYGRWGGWILETPGKVANSVISSNEKN